MDKNISLLKKLNLFKQFRSVIKQNKEELKQQFNIRVDRSYRLYTVLNIPEQLIGEQYSIKKSDIDKISENFTREFTNQLANFLDKKGLLELYSVYSIEKVDKYSYLIVIGFSQFKSNKFYDNIYYKVLPISIITIVSVIIFMLI